MKPASLVPLQGMFSECRASNELLKGFQRLTAAKPTHVSGLACEAGLQPRDVE